MKNMNVNHTGDRTHNEKTNTDDMRQNIKARLMRVNEGHLEGLED